ncbi:glycoside hydrolase family 47 protein [Streptomyces synnematoformans]|uniref:glycoside hydrolase family 47 protein n=1 Tax=Streptomyces synnematoformans TaxID=415721 RepID=UPI0031D9DAC0
MRPVSGTAREFFAEGHPVGLSVIEALDTLYVMELDDDLRESADWLERNLDFDIDADFHVFESIIRVVGGLLAGHLVTGRRSLLDLCVDVTDRLLPAFTKSPTGMPYTRANLRTVAAAQRGRDRAPGGGVGRPRLVPPGRLRHRRDHRPPPVRAGVVLGRAGRQGRRPPARRGVPPLVGVRPAALARAARGDRLRHHDRDLARQPVPARVRQRRLRPVLADRRRLLPPHRRGGTSRACGPTPASPAGTRSWRT